MKRMALVLVFMILPAVAYGMEQSFTQQGLKATVRLTPEKLEPQAKVQLSLRLEQDGAQITDKNVQLIVYQGDSTQPIVTHLVDLLDTEYVDSWQFDQPGNYRVVLKIADPKKTDTLIQYEIMATVPEADHDHGFFSHHFGDGKWGWWGAGMMLIMMVPMMILVL